VPPRAVLDWVVKNWGMSRSKAWAVVNHWRRAQRKRGEGEERGHPPGRQPRSRGTLRQAQFELAALLRDKQRAIVEEGERGFATWTKLRGELARDSSGPECVDYVARIRCSRETLGAAGEIVLHLAPPVGARNDFERYRQWIEDARAKLPIPVRIAWEAPL
jgi:hypothetical protein